jgi:putative RNA 2'-phosphotransferase
MSRDQHSTDPLRAASHRLAWLLRHGARETGLPMDTAGFAPVEDVLRHARLRRDALDRIVEENNKARYELSPDGRRIRARQGHSLEGTPVTLDGLESSWEAVTDDAPIYHGTSVEAARAILRSEGIHSAARTHVHLAPETDSAVGKRAGVGVLLTISPARLRAAGLGLFRAPNGVILCRFVPRTAIVDVTGATRGGRAAETELRALLAPSPAPAVESAMHEA